MLVMCMVMVVMVIMMVVVVVVVVPCVLAPVPRPIGLLQHKAVLQEAVQAARVERAAAAVHPGAGVGYVGGSGVHTCVAVLQGRGGTVGWKGALGFKQLRCMQKGLTDDTGVLVSQPACTCLAAKTAIMPPAFHHQQCSLDTSSTPAEPAAPSTSQPALAPPWQNIESSHPVLYFFSHCSSSSTACPHLQCPPTKQHAPAPVAHTLTSCKHLCLPSKPMHTLFRKCALTCSALSLPACPCSVR